MKFQGKVVLITGASSGIGAGTARYFAGEGASLSLTGRNKTNLTKVAEECKFMGCENILTVIADLTKDADVAKIMNETVKKFGKLDVLVNNAGISEFGDIENSSLEQLDRIFLTNVRSVYQLTKLAIPLLTQTKGNVVNVSSLSGMRAFPGFTAYSMSKAALNQFTKCVALELASKHVRVNSVNPAVTDTDIFRRAGLDENAYKEFLKKYKVTHPLGRYGNVQDVARSIGFLASDDASFITGVQLCIDGGEHVMCPIEKNFP